MKKKVKNPPKDYYTEAQLVLDSLYAFKECIETINLTSRNLKGNLSFAEYPLAKTIVLTNNELTELDVSACKNLKYLDIQNNHSLKTLIIYDRGPLNININHPNIARLKIIAKKKQNADEGEETEENSETKKYSFANLTNDTKNLPNNPYFLGRHTEEKIYSEQEFQDLKDFFTNQANNTSNIYISNPFCQKSDCFNATPHHLHEKNKLMTRLALALNLPKPTNSYLKYGLIGLAIVFGIILLILLVVRGWYLFFRQKQIGEEKPKKTEENQEKKKMKKK